MGHTRLAWRQHYGRQAPPDGRLFQRLASGVPPIIIDQLQVSRLAATGPCEPAVFAFLALRLIAAHSRMPPFIEKTRPAMNRFWLFLLVSVIVSLTVANAHAFNPPKDSAGPITVAIVAPDAIDRFDAATEIRVVVENAGEQQVQAVLRLSVVDAWRISPDQWTIDLPARSKKDRTFELRASGKVYRGHYPIHVRAECREGDRVWSVHPIHIFEAKPPVEMTSRPRPEWKPFLVEQRRELALWQLPVHRAVFAVFDQPAETMPAGWSGSHGEHRGSFAVSVQNVGGESKPTIGIHPPWHQGRAGTAWIEYPLQLPDAGPITLRMFTAMSPHPEKGGDGVTFRVRAIPFDAPEGQLGEIVWEDHRDQQRWTAAEVELSRWAGKAIRLQLESHPGPRRNTAFDHSFWGEVVLSTRDPKIVSSTPANVRVEQPVITLESSTGGDQADALRVEISPGRRGLLDATVQLTAEAAKIAFDGFRVAVLGFSLEDPRAAVQLISANAEPAAELPDELFHPCSRLKQDKQDKKDHSSNAGEAARANIYQVRHRFRTVWGEFDLVGRLWLDRGMLRAAWWIENGPPPQPWHVCRIEQASVGAFDQPVELLYFGPGNVVRRPREYVVNYDGHRLSTSMIGLEFASGGSLLMAAEQPPLRLEVRPHSRQYTLVGSGPTLFTFVPRRELFAAVRHWRDRNGRTAAGGVEKLAGRFVFDLWGGRYGESAEALQKAFAYGLTDACVVWHNWQRWGYDYRLPDILPPNPQLGTVDEFSRLGRVCREAGVLFAPHDNYIDFYPDAEGFSYVDQIAFRPDGQPVKAWLNEGRGAQSYRFRADTLAPFVRRNVSELRERFAPTAYFIDVWASAGPYDYWTSEGKFFDKSYTNRVWCEQFAWIRDTLGDRAPQISESGHDGQIGFLDGAQANHLRIGQGRGRRAWGAINWDCAEAQRIAWFDAAYHDCFILHGAGYADRYLAGLDRRMHGMYSDDYIATEMLTGRPAMVHQPFGRDVVRKYWLTQTVARALALRRIERVEFVEGNLHRQHVVWNNGSVWVNRSGADWSPKPEITLPPYGFWAELTDASGRPVTAGIVRRNGVIVEETRSADAIYVNGRRLNQTGHRIHLSVNSVEAADAWEIRWKLVYHLDQPVPEGFRPFLHLCDAEGEIVTQASFDARVLEGRTGDVEVEARCRLPSGVRLPVELELRYGFYRPADGQRLHLEELRSGFSRPGDSQRLAISGRDDGTGRIRAGSVKVSDGYDRFYAVAWSALKAGDLRAASANDPAPEYYADQQDQLDAAKAWAQRQNIEGKPIDFEALTTADGVRVAPTKDGLLLIPLPEGPAEGTAIVVRPAKLPWKLPALRRAITMDGHGRQGEEVPLVRDGEAVSVVCPAKAFAVLLSGD